MREPTSEFGLDLDVDFECAIIARQSYLPLDTTKNYMSAISFFLFLSSRAQMGMTQ